MAAQMDFALIGNRAEVTRFVNETETTGIDYHSILKGWRAEFIGNRLLDVLKGNSDIKINSETKLSEIVE